MSSLLEGGGRRRMRHRRRARLLGGTRGTRRRAWPIATVLIVAPALAAAIAAWLALNGGGEAPGSSGAAKLHSGNSVEARPHRAPPSRAAISLSTPDAFQLRFKQPPRSGIVFDLESGRVLWRLNPSRRLSIASLAKIMTALVVVERTRSSERVKVTRAALAYQGSGIGLLPKGRRVPIEAMLHGLLVVSGNDAAIALADHVSGSERRFVRTMNGTARRLALSCTSFASPHGLEPANRSCAADLAVLTRLAMRKRRIARAVRKRQAVVRFPIAGGRLYLNSTNPLLRAGYAGTIGLKTGDTDQAGRCFVAVVRRRGRTLGAVLLHSPDPAAQARRLLDRAFRAR